MEILAKGVKFMTRVYVIHADEDYLSFDRLAAQARSAKLPVDFDHMPAKQTWVPHWKGNCRNRIYRCGGAIVFLSKHTAQGGVGWELECAQACALPMLGLCVEESKTPNDSRGTRRLAGGGLELAGDRTIHPNAAQGIVRQRWFPSESSRARKSSTYLVGIW